MRIMGYHAAILGIVLMSAPIVACAKDLIVAGRSAQNVFRNEGVPKLLQAAIHKDVLEAERLLADGVNVNAMGDGGVTPLLWMLVKHDIAAMKMLLDLGADPNRYAHDGVGPAVWLAAGSGQKGALQVLLEHGGDPNLAFGNDSPLMMAIGDSYLDCAQLLLQHGADINFSEGPESALSQTMVHVRFSDAVWVLNHGYTHDLVMAQRMLAIKEPRLGQKKLKEQALEIVNRLLVAQQKQ